MAYHSNRADDLFILNIQYYLSLRELRCLSVKTSCPEMKIIILDNRKTMKQYLHVQFFPHDFFT